jgi:uncharacterized protein
LSIPIGKQSLLTKRRPDIPDSTVVESTVYPRIDPGSSDLTQSREKGDTSLFKRALMKNLLIIFAKAPEPGLVKTRLIPFLTPKMAALLQEAFLLDIIQMTDQESKQLNRSMSWSRLLACAPDTEHPFFQRCERNESIRLICQKGDDLGERMDLAFRQTFSEGFEKVVIIGCDAPTLPISCIESAFESLSAHSLVLGPSLDGGYYLIGAKCPPTELLYGMAWGTEAVLSETLQRLNATKRSYHLLPFWYDIDLPRDFIFLRQHLEYRKMKGEPALEATKEILGEINNGI